MIANSPQDILESPRSTSFPCLKMSQPIGDFFVASVDYKILREICFFDVRRVLDEQRDVERYLGIQRPLSSQRVGELKKYVNFVDASFPTSVIIAVDSACAEYNESKQILTLSNSIKNDLKNSILFRQIARVLDGQHRIDGLSGFVGDKFDLSVTIFVGIDIAQQAQIFSTVNLEQTKVQKSLAYDLFALASSRSPQKTCHNVVVALDNDRESPFYQRIKRLGTATDGRYAEKITQSTFTEALIGYISADAKIDRDRLLRGQNILRPNADELRERPLRTLFLDEEDIRIAEIIKNYFDAVRRRWPVAWNYEGRGIILNRTNGFRAFMRLFGFAYQHITRPGNLVLAEEFEGLFRKSKLNDTDFNVENFPPGTSGEARLYRDLMEDLKLDSKLI